MVTDDAGVQRTHADGSRRMLAECARRNPGCDETHQDCCRFPKTCSPYPFDEAPVTEADLEQRRGPVATDEDDYIETDITEWAVQCHTRDGDLHTGRAMLTERGAVESGRRLEAINGAEWWLVSRRRFVTVRTTAWEKTDITYPPEGSKS